MSRILHRLGFVVGVALASHLAGSPLQAADCHEHSTPSDEKKDPKKIDDKVKEIAGTAEFLRDVPKHFASLKAVDKDKRQVTLLIEGEVLAKVWPLAPDAEIKVMGWWGRLEDLVVGDRVWVWLKTDRKKQPVAVSMIADEISQQDINDRPLTVEEVGTPGIRVKAWKEPARLLKTSQAYEVKTGDKIFVQSHGEGARIILRDAKALAAAREKQKALMRQRWAKDGLPGAVAFVHVFSGEMDVILDHETMRWARSLQAGDAVSLVADPPIKGIVKRVQPWRERTQLRLVVKNLDLAELAAGQRVRLLRTPPPLDVDTAVFPPDLDRPRTRQERIEWFLASIYCTCGVSGDRCTGHFYTLASCNPNACGMPRHMRGILEKKIDQGKTDRQIFEDLLKSQGPNLLKPHLLP